MIVTYHGESCLKIQYGDFTLAYNPPKIMKDGKVPRFGANVVLVSTHTDATNGPENMEYGQTVPFVIDGPGNYEITGLSIEGIGGEVNLSGENYINTVYRMNLDGMNLVFMGLATDAMLTPEFRGKIGTCDIIFVPLGHDDMSNQMAYKMAIGSDAGLIIPIGSDSLKIKSFLKEAGQEKVTSIDKLTVKKKDLTGKEGEVVLLNL
ncbi:hypothetical protein A3C57_02125 [Candidatus Nomurabacteria bacterium RIFCSPHIGHO2_02_FULL_33_12]|uniref:Zn-dependent hydrolase n=1 Tax=Candidatus Nomurabacteria bacterium RIFCSPLOWO2_01_FULL_33_17 TaxID=1801764 RepID=A0A1F6WP92_9BACT|nr:MAG: hypothetical protein A3C57_02125 [Candidatus Nomurabacteria bacterium RIFCSPHIGHO2_02_FULL_33_12]OGI83693.1 MAG: hypothetical protein A2903_01395 [Candidatus Nomurabacteria bacterium RIFCSPLOWO2_01_FULL_33_17]